MEETGPSPFDGPPTTELTNNTQLSGTPSPISGFVAPEVQGRQKSPMPQVVGILAVIIAVLGVCFGLFGLLTANSSLTLYEEISGETSILISALVWIIPILGIVASIVFGYAGLELYNYKKRAIFVGLGAVGISLIADLLETFVEAQTVANGAENSDAGLFVGGIGLAFTLLCNGCCAMLLLIPLLASPQDLE